MKCILPCRGAGGTDTVVVVTACERSATRGINASALGVVGVTVGVVGEFSITDAKLVVDVGSSAIENDSRRMLRPASITVASATWILGTHPITLALANHTAIPAITLGSIRVPRLRAHLHQLLVQIQAIARHRKLPFISTVLSTSPHDSQSSSILIARSKAAR